MLSTWVVTWSSRCFSIRRCVPIDVGLAYPSEAYESVQEALRKLRNVKSCY